MIHPVTVLLIIILGIGIPALITWKLLNLITWKLLKRKPRHPIVCLCANESRAAVVLLCDLREAEDKFWRELKEVPPERYHAQDPGRLYGESVDPFRYGVSVFVFDTSRLHGQECLHSVLSRCCVQRAVFKIPPVIQRDPAVTAAEAQDYFFGKP